MTYIKSKRAIGNIMPGQKASKVCHQMSQGRSDIIWKNILSRIEGLEGLSPYHFSGFLKKHMKIVFFVL